MICKIIGHNPLPVWKTNYEKSGYYYICFRCNKRVNMYKFQEDNPEINLQLIPKE